MEDQRPLADRRQLHFIWLGENKLNATLNPSTGAVDYDALPQAFGLDAELSF